jgi:hypothetical protein
MASIPLVTLQNAGDYITLKVTKCGELPFGRYKEIEFVGKDPHGNTAAVRVPKQSADRQLQRLELTYDGAVGRTITIKRDPNKAEPAKAFWGLYLEGGAPGATAPALRTSAEHAANGNGHSGTASVDRREKLSHSYRQCTAYVIETIVPMYLERKISVTAADIAQMVDSLFRGVTHP